MATKRSVKYNYESLANAIIKQAYDDLVFSVQPEPHGAHRQYRRYSKMYLRDDCVTFFTGRWYSTLTALPPEILLNAALLEKQKGIVYDWLDILFRDRRLTHKHKKQVDFSFRTVRTKGGRKLIKDKRFQEYEAKKRWRKARIKKEEKQHGKNKRHNDDLHSGTA